SAHGSVETLSPNLPREERALLASEWGMYSKTLGDLVTARRAFEFELAIRQGLNDFKTCSVVLQNRCEVALLAGSLGAAFTSADEALSVALVARDGAEQLDAHCYVAAALAARGKVELARSHFLAATKMQGKPLNSLRGFWEASLRLACGDLIGACEQA